MSDTERQTGEQQREQAPPAETPDETPAPAAAPVLVHAPLMRRLAEGGSPRGLSPRAWRSMQRVLGNQHVQRMIEGSAPAVARDAAAVQREGPETAIAGGEQATELADKVTVTYTQPAIARRTYNVTSGSLRGTVSEMSGRGEWGRGGAENLSYDQADTSVTINVTLFTELPVWTALSTQVDAVKNEWNRMLGALTSHEQRHADIAIEHLNAMRDAMKDQAPTAIAGIFNTKLAALQAAQRAYDTSTTNGQTEGVTIDWSVDPAEHAEESAGPTESAGAEEE